VQGIHLGDGTENSGDAELIIEFAFVGSVLLRTMILVAFGGVAVGPVLTEAATASDPRVYRVSKGAHRTG